MLDIYTVEEGGEEVQVISSHKGFNYVKVSRRENSRHFSSNACRKKKSQREHGIIPFPIGFANSIQYSAEANDNDNVMIMCNNYFKCRCCCLLCVSWHGETAKPCGAQNSKAQIRPLNEEDKESQRRWIIVYEIRAFLYVAYHQHAVM